MKRSLVALRSGRHFRREAENRFVVIPHQYASHLALPHLVQGREGVLHVLGMAQGHYPLAPDELGEWRIRPSPGLEGVLMIQASIRYLASKAARAVVFPFPGLTPVVQLR